MERWVSCLKISPIPKRKYPEWAFIAIIIGICLFSISFIVGLIVIAISAGALIYINQVNSTYGSYLIVNMNSGESFYFSCNDESFLIEAENEIVKCFNDHGKSVINMQYCKIENSQIGGKNNSFEKR